jgi:hypothetical protein
MHIDDIICTITDLHLSPYFIEDRKVTRSHVAASYTAFNKSREADIFPENEQSRVEN